MVGDVRTPSIVNALAMALLKDSITRREEQRKPLAAIIPRQVGVMSDTEMADAFAEVMGDE